MLFVATPFVEYWLLQAAAALMYQNALGSGFVTPVVERWLLQAAAALCYPNAFVCSPARLSVSFRSWWSGFWLGVGLFWDFGSRACDLLRRQVAFVFMDFESGLFDLLSWRACAAAFMLLEVLLVCAWAAAAFAGFGCYDPLPRPQGVSDRL